MRQLINPCLLIASMLWGVILAEQWLAVNAPFGMYGRLGLVLVAAIVTAWLCPLTFNGRTRPSPTSEPTELVSYDPHSSEDLRKELALAIEHLESIRVLLVISGDYKQPAPRAASANLD